jgi:CheY-like chemotaxis protein
MTKFDLLIIDDDELFLMLNKREIIKSEFHRNPITFNNGPMGLNWLNENDGQGKNTLIFLDINMPQMDAWGFLDSLNKAERQANIKIYIVTSSGRFQKTKLKLLLIPMC